MALQSSLAPQRWDGENHWAVVRPLGRTRTSMCFQQLQASPAFCAHVKHEFSQPSLPCALLLPSSCPLAICAHAAKAKLWTWNTSVYTELGEPKGAFNAEMRFRRMQGKKSMSLKRHKRSGEREEIHQFTSSASVLPRVICGSHSTERSPKLCAHRLPQELSIPFPWYMPLKSPGCEPSTDTIKHGELYKRPQWPGGWALEAPTHRGTYTSQQGTGRDNVGRADLGHHLFLLPASLVDCHMEGGEWG